MVLACRLALLVRTPESSHPDSDLMSARSVEAMHGFGLLHPNLLDSGKERINKWKDGLTQND